MIVSGRVVYDFVGRAVEQFYPITEPKGAAQHHASTRRSTRSRRPGSATTCWTAPTRTVLPDDTVDHHGVRLRRRTAPGVTQFETVGTDANGKSKRTYTDVRELTTAVKEFNPAGGQPVIWTSYGYDALGQLTAVTDDQRQRHHDRRTTTSAAARWWTAPTPGRTEHRLRPGRQRDQQDHREAGRRAQGHRVRLRLQPAHGDPLPGLHRPTTSPTPTARPGAPNNARRPDHRRHRRRRHARPASTARSARSPRRPARSRRRAATIRTYTTQLPVRHVEPGAAA